MIQSGIDLYEHDEDQRFGNGRQAMARVQRARNKAVRHHLAEFDPGGRRRERADAERIEEIRDRTQRDRFEIYAESGSVCSRHGRDRS